MSKEGYFFLVGDRFAIENESQALLNLIDEDTSATRQAERRVIEFFKERTGA